MKRRSFLSGLASALALPYVPGISSWNSSRIPAEAEGSASRTHPTRIPDASDYPRAAAQAWFRDARFGMFIHWGVYSVLGKGEWVMHQDEMTVKEYEKLPPKFNPTEFDAESWVSLAKNAGMRYITITSKHHDGFAMWDSDVSDYNIVDATPYGQDVLRMLADECEKQGIELFFYHSHLDWRQPDYYPRGRTGEHSGRPDNGDFIAYLDYMNAQVEELSGGDYGDLAGFWFDGWWDQKLQGLGQDYAPAKATQIDWNLQRTYNLIHELQPHALIGNNHHVAPFPGEDFQMFERDLPGKNTAGFNTATISDLPLETADTINQNWGYNKSDDDFKSPKELIHYLVRAAGNDSNLLLNVGPTPRGTIQPEFRERLQRMGEWTNQFGETIYGTRGGPMPPQRWGVATRKGWTVYVHVLDPDVPETLVLPGTEDLVIESAHHFESGADLTVTHDSGGAVEVHLPNASRNPVDTILVLEMAG